jgi:prepilin-type N-terminal cleavage/methylation domain-containing protein
MKKIKNHLTKRFQNRGITLIELLVVMVILVAATTLGRVGFNVMQGIMQSSAMSKTQREAQVILYDITKEIRNCSKIKSLSYDRLVLNVFNTRDGFNVEQNNTLFTEAFIGTTTYQFVSSNSESYLRKTTIINNVTREDKKLLKNLLLTPNATNYIFNACAATASPPCPKPWEQGAYSEPIIESLEIWLRMSPLYVKGSESNYVAQSMKRTKSNL